MWLLAVSTCGLFDKQINTCGIVERTIRRLVADIDMGVYYPSGACPVYKWDPTMVITVPADVLAPNGARSSAGTMMTKSYICLQISAMIPYHVYGLDDVIHNGGRHSKPHGPISVNKYAIKWSEGYRLRYWRPSWSGS